MLRTNRYKQIYRSSSSDFDKDFLNPCYRESITFDRASGYFTVDSLVMSIDGILQFIANGGKMRLICNPELSEEDIALINAGYNLDNEKIIKDLIRELKPKTEYDEKLLCALDVICNMISDGMLDIKVAYMPQGIYHEKFGIFTDDIGDKVYFIGSSNETKMAKIANWESFTVRTSWTEAYAVAARDQEESMIESESRYFDKLWDDKIKKLKVISFPEAVEKHMFNEYKRCTSVSEAVKSYYKAAIRPNKKTLYDYQENAIKEFIENGGAHFYEMATGTGKTFTSIKTVEKVSSQNPHMLIVVCVPQIDLQRQWLKAFQDEDFENIYLIGGDVKTRQTANNISQSLIDYAIYVDKPIVCIATYDTYFDKFCDKCRNIDNLFIIVDEAHNLTPSQVALLPQNPKYRLGLSATIERYNEYETQAIINYFTLEKRKPFYYGIEDAINRGFLSPYYYHMINVRLTEEEFISYQRKTQLIIYQSNADKPDEEAITKLRLERSLIVKKAANKIDVLKTMINKYDFENSVVYCGQGKREEQSIINNVTKVLGDAHYSVSQFTSKTEDRNKVLYEFEKGYYDTLVAIRCFDEGVDVPKLDKIYIMASDASRRQTVQRRGRVLRKCKETGKTIANIYDMVVLPPEGNTDTLGCRALVASEMIRVDEYARLANNKEDIQKIVNNIKDLYKVTEEDLKNEE